VAEVRRANQPVLPMLELESLVAAAGDVLRARVHVANDGPELRDVVIEARFGETAGPLGIDELLAFDASVLDVLSIADRFSESVAEVRAEGLPAHRATALGELSIVVPNVPGSHDLVLRLRAGGEPVAENRYPIHVVQPRPVPQGDGAFVVGEGALDHAAAARAREVLEEGGVVVVLAQPAEAAEHYPVPVTLLPVATAWGSTVFHFTTDHGALPCLPRRNVLVAEDSTIRATTVVGSIGDAAFPDTPVVVAYKPVPGAITGTVVGSHAVGRGRLVLCQYRLVERATQQDAAARALLADLLRWAAELRPTVQRSRTTKADGRSMTSYSWTADRAR
jgi:hypothetical protein